jgi:threonine dehydratase
MVKSPTRADIENAYQRISPFIKKTPLLTCSTLDVMLDSRIFFKCENFQKSGAFKYRGATNAISLLEPQQAQNGVCTHSSGNHAQALALAAKTRNIDAHIVMPDNAPLVKVNAVKGYGGKITFCRPTLQAREETLQRIQDETGASFIHPYDNLSVIEGQATCLYEVINQLEVLPDYIISPCGGGGLLTGTLLTSEYFYSSVKVFGAEPLAANDAWKSLKANQFIPSDNPVTIADGLKTSLGTYTWPYIKDHVQDILTATEESIVKAMFLVWERMKIVIEPSAAVPLAALFENKELFRNKNVVIIFSGGNTDLNNLPWK